MSQFLASVPVQFLVAIPPTVIALVLGILITAYLQSSREPE